MCVDEHSGEATACLKRDGVGHAGLVDALVRASIGRCCVLCPFSHDSSAFRLVYLHHKTLKHLIGIHKLELFVQILSALSALRVQPLVGRVEMGLSTTSPSSWSTGSRSVSGLLPHPSQQGYDEHAKDMPAVGSNITYVFAGHVVQGSRPR